MGSFSWLRADNLTEFENISGTQEYKMLIPKEFGGGYIQDNYMDYGDIFDKNTGLEYDMYELLAFWNKESTFVEGEKTYTVSERLQFDGAFPNLKPKDKYTDNNRCLGIDIGCYTEQIKKLKYPLKLVSVEYKGDYESCKNFSDSDPNQGFFPTYRK